MVAIAERRRAARRVQASARRAASVKITNRDVVVAYRARTKARRSPSSSSSTARSDAQKVAFTMTRFRSHHGRTRTTSIVVVPKAIGNAVGQRRQRRRSAASYEVVDWVYATFGEKFDIRSMWASGGSWGSFYLSSTFACDPKFEDRLRGVRMVVGGGCPRRSNRLACIVAQQELEGGGMPLSEAEKEMNSTGRTSIRTRRRTAATAR